MRNSDYKTLGGKELFAAIQRGDESAFTAAYQKYADGLHVLAYRYLKDNDLANNAVQHVFTRLWEYRDDIVVSSSLQNYLFTMVKNFIMNQIRNNSKALEKNYEMLQERGYVEETIVSSLDENELHQRLLSAIMKLSGSNQMIVNMKLEGRSNQEIADYLDIPVNTVKSKYTTSIKKLRDILAILFPFVLILLAL